MRLSAAMVVAILSASVIVVMFAVEPTASGASPNEPGRLDPALRAFLIAGIPTPDASTEREWPTRVAIAEIGRGDDKHDILVYISGRAWCGSGGCDLLILEPNGASFRLLGDVSVAQLPIRRLDTTSNGHPDIGVEVRGGGIIPGYQARLRFDGSRYPDNSSAPPAEPMKGKPKGAVLIARPIAGAPDAARGDLLYGG